MEDRYLLSFEKGESRCVITVSLTKDPVRGEGARVVQYMP
jgi:hypothetical protein